jgi:predicted DCC family thiol-disulfide oxidoreductase YuxK
MTVKVPILIFDGDCAFCSSSARALRKMTKNRVAIEPYQFLDLADYSLTEDQTSKAVYFVTPTDTFSAAKAIARCLIDARTPWSVAGFLLNIPVVISVGELVYAWVSKNRHRLPGGTPECSLPRQENQ